MKRIVILLIVVHFLASCKKEEKTIIKVPDSTDTTTNQNKDTLFTIAKLKTLYSDDLNLIDSNLTIVVKVTANDESGNFYKTLVIQDNSAGIELKLDRSSLFNYYQIGQRVKIKLKGMYIGKYNGLQQLGYEYNGVIGRLPDILIGEHLLLDSLPGNSIQPTLINIGAIDDSDLGMLVKIEGVAFESPGSSFSEVSSITNRRLIDINGTIIPNFVVRTSNYSSFSSSLLPFGRGTIIGILSKSLLEWQFYIRNINDVQNFVMPTVLLNYSFAVNSNDWTIKSESGSKDWTFFSGDPSMAITGFGSDAPCKDWLISPEVDLGTAPNSVLTFKSIMKNSDTGNANPLKIRISSNYSGDVATATWTDINATLSTFGSWTINTVSGFPNSGKYRIAFYYESSGTSNTTATLWQIKDVKLAN